MNLKIDHIVIGAPTLKQGVDYIFELLGVDIPFGGVHLTMGTHNHLMQLGNDSFLEVIAINDEIEVPSSPRWYGLDDPFIRQTINLEPTLLTWVINTKDIKDLMTKALFSLGEIEFVSRGNLNWKFGLPSDGRLLGGGMLPYAIEWNSVIHPSKNMSDLGCRLLSLEIHHPNIIWLTAALESIDALKLVELKKLPNDTPPYLVANIKTPSGIKRMTSRKGFL